MRSSWPRPFGLDGDLLRVSKQLENKLNEGTWHWWDVPVVESPVAQDAADPVGEGVPVEGVAEVGSGGVGLDSDVPPRGVEPGLLGHVDAPQAVLLWKVASPKRTEGSTIDNFLQVRLANIPGEIWLSGMASSIEEEFSPTPRIFDELPDVQLESGGEIGAYAMKVGRGPEIYCPKFVRVGALLVWR